MGSLRFSQLRNARRVLDMKGRIAAGIVGMPYHQLRKGERLDAVVPAQYVKSARGVIDLADLVRKSPETHGAIGHRRLALPFRRPRCGQCRIELHSVGSKYTVRRGEHWYFLCPRCGRRYWSNDGRAHPVKPKGGNWRLLKDRIRCNDCQIECSVVEPRAKRSRSRLWECPQCRKRYRNVAGRAVPNRSTQAPRKRRD